MEVLHMGRTELPDEVIQEYINSLAEVYTPEVPHFYYPETQCGWLTPRTL